MLQAFDLFDYDDVVDNADDIVGSLCSGQMPCDGVWPAGQVDTLQQWIEQEAVKLGRAIARDPVFAPFTAEELTPGDAVADDDALAQAIAANPAVYGQPHLHGADGRTWRPAGRRRLGRHGQGPAFYRGLVRCGSRG
jgi:hypothetical protein